MILVLVGFTNDFSDEEIERRFERKRKSHYRFTYDGRFDAYEYHHGIGYGAERPNVAQLVCIIICLSFSTVYLLMLISSPECHSGAKRAWVLIMLMTILIMSNFFINDQPLLKHSEYRIDSFTSLRQLSKQLGSLMEFLESFYSAAIAATWNFPATNAINLN